MRVVDGVEGGGVAEGQRSHGPSCRRSASMAKIGLSGAERRAAAGRMPAVCG